MLAAIRMRIAVKVQDPPDKAQELIRQYPPDMLENLTVRKHRAHVQETARRGGDSVRGSRMCFCFELDELVLHIVDVTK